MYRTGAVNAAFFLLGCSNSSEVQVLPKLPAAGGAGPAGHAGGEL
jgi:hypothetical protein